VEPDCKKKKTAVDEPAPNTMLNMRRRGGLATGAFPLPASRRSNQYSSPAVTLHGRYRSAPLLHDSFAELPLHG